MISIKKNRTPILTQCKFLCDGKLDKKLDEYELTRFLNCHSTTLFFLGNLDREKRLCYIHYSNLRNY